MIIFLYGPDTYRSKKKIEELKKKRNFSDSNIVILEGEELSPEELHRVFLTPDLLSSKRLVIVKNVIKKTKKEKVLKEILAIVDKLSKNKRIEIIFWEEDLSALRGKRKEIFDLLVEKSENYYFPLLSFKETYRWLKEEIEKRGGKIEDKAIKKLIFYRGNNLWELSNEIDKLIAYSEKKLIKEKDIEDLVEVKLDENIFHLVDALAEGHREKSLKLLNFQLKRRQSWPLILSALTNHFRGLIITQEMLRTEGYVNIQFLADELKVYPFVAKKFLIQARKYSFDELKKIYQALLKIDFRLKTEKVNPELLFDLFVLGVKKKK